jgi:hypothetical protein
MAETAISLIIPCYRDEACLGQLLSQLRQLPSGTAESLQIIVVDAANNPACRELCAQFDAQWLAATPCRGEQLRLGAARAENPLLWFLHADAQLQGDPLLAIRASIAGGAVGGYFAFHFAGPGQWQGSLIEALTNWRTRFGIPYGDQGLFASTAAYRDAGQHSPWPLFEEVELVKRLRQAGPFVQLEQGLLVDPRRWQRDGWWLRSLRNRLFALARMLGVPASTLARRYGPATTPRQSTE